MQARDDDHESLKPHPDVDQNRDRKQRPRVDSQLSSPQQLGNQHIAANHDPVRPGIGSQSSIHEDELLVHIAAIPSSEEFDAVGVAHHQAGGQHHATHHVQVARRDQILQSV